MATKTIGCNFRKLSLIKAAEICISDSKVTSLEKIINDFVNEKKDSRVELTKGKEIILTEGVGSEEGDFFLKFEILKYGEGHSIKDKNTRALKGEITPDDYIERFQCVFFKKIDKDTYNLIFQRNKMGFDSSFLYNELWAYVTNAKKNNEISDIYSLHITKYLSKSFLERFKNITEVSSIKLENVYESPEFRFNDRGDKTAEFEIIEKRIMIIKPLKKRYGKIKDGELIKYINEKEDEYPDLRIKISGKSGKNTKESFINDNFELSEEIKVEIDLLKKILYNDMKKKMEVCIKNLEKIGIEEE